MALPCRIRYPTKCAAPRCRTRPERSISPVMSVPWYSFYRCAPQPPCLDFYRSCVNYPAQGNHSIIRSVRLFFVSLPRQTFRSHLGSAKVLYRQLRVVRNAVTPGSSASVRAPPLLFPVARPTSGVRSSYGFLVRHGA